MQNSTRYKIKSALEQDPSLSKEDRKAFFARLEADPAKQLGANDTDRVLSRAEVANMLSCSKRLVDELAREQHLTRVKLPGRTKQALGISALSVQRFIAIASRKDGGA